MLLRFTLENVFSFGKRKEFNLFPYTRLNTLKHHCYEALDIKVLKMAALYGANGAGKSNLVKALEGLKDLVTEGRLPLYLREAAFKLHISEEEKLASKVLAIEFITNEQAYYYGVEWKGGILLTEELYHSGLGKKEDQLLFERKTNSERVTTIVLAKNIEQDEKGRLLKEILIQEFAKPDVPILKWLAARESDLFAPMKEVMAWFEDGLKILSPTSRFDHLPIMFERNASFQKYASAIMRTFKTGVDILEIKEVVLEHLLGKEEEVLLATIKEDLLDKPDTILALSQGEKAYSVVEDNGVFLAKYLVAKHLNARGDSVLLELEQESEGTRRLMAFLPLLFERNEENVTYIIDEMDRSLHPVLVKELVRKFAGNPKTKGQLIFTTHESNLLDQEIFRQDEIWFAEKDLEGSTDLYSLSDFKKHKTIDIQKGYLNGRYGSIPFLGDLSALNWEDYRTE